MYYSEFDFVIKQDNNNAKLVRLSKLFKDDSLYSVIQTKFILDADGEYSIEIKDLGFMRFDALPSREEVDKLDQVKYIDKNRSVIIDSIGYDICNISDVSSWMLYVLYYPFDELDESDEEYSIIKDKEEMITCYKKLLEAGFKSGLIDIDKIHTDELKTLWTNKEGKEFKVSVNVYKGKAILNITRLEEISITFFPFDKYKMCIEKFEDYIPKIIEICNEGNFD